MVALCPWFPCLMSESSLLKTPEGTEDLQGICLFWSSGEITANIDSLSSQKLPHGDVRWIRRVSRNILNTWLAEFTLSVLSIQMFTYNLREWVFASWRANGVVVLSYVSVIFQHRAGLLLNLSTSHCNHESRLFCCATATLCSEQVIIGQIIGNTTLAEPWASPLCNYLCPAGRPPSESSQSQTLRGHKCDTQEVW